MSRLLLCGVLLASATTARGSESRRRLVPELCEAEQSPAVTSLAVPDPVRASARRADRASHTDRGRSRSAIPGWLIVVAAVAAASAVAMAANR